MPIVNNNDIVTLVTTGLKTKINEQQASIILLSSDVDQINTQIGAIETQVQSILGQPILNPPTDQNNLKNLSTAVTVDSNGNLKISNLGATSTDPQNTVMLKEMNKTIVGLGNVDNTSDLNKPISTTTQTALNLKANQSDLIKGKYWKPVVISGGAGTRSVALQTNLVNGETYRVGLTWGNQPTSAIKYVITKKTNINAPLERYWHSGLAGLLPNILQLIANGTSGFEITVPFGTVATDGLIFTVDIETSLQN